MDRMVDGLWDLASSNTTMRDNALFPPTVIFNESWMLRLVFKKWLQLRDLKGMPFRDSSVVSGETAFSKLNFFCEGRLGTAFAKGTGKRPESSTHADGIIGHFTIGEGRKAKVLLNDGLGFLAVFEAKMYSGFSKGTTYADEYNQISRTCACIIHMLQDVNLPEDAEIYVVAIHPRDHPKMVNCSYLEKKIIKGEIEQRIREHNPSTWAGYDWQTVLERIQIRSVHWETVLKEINDPTLTSFYDKCVEFNHP